MAYTEEIEYQYEVVPPFKTIQKRTNTVTKKDGTQVGYQIHRTSIPCGTLDASDNLVNTDVSGEPTELQEISKIVWTADVKNAYKAHLIATKPPTES
tara:strand:- start:47 stop:337 length:291 start_codon:yes stop_codon:yes gene_type:complete